MVFVRTELQTKMMNCLRLTLDQCATGDWCIIYTMSLIRSKSCGVSFNSARESLFPLERHPVVFQAIQQNEGYLSNLRHRKVRSNEMGVQEGGLRRRSARGSIDEMVSLSSEERYFSSSVVSETRYQVPPPR